VDADNLRLIRRMGPEKLHGDDMPVPVLEPGNGKTKIGRRLFAMTGRPTIAKFATDTKSKGQRPVSRSRLRSKEHMCRCAV
jgi:hypothetical protein